MSQKDNIQEQEQEKQNANNQDEQQEQATGEEQATEKEQAQNEQPEAQQAEEKDPLQELQDKYDALNEKYMRLYSEFENFRRRTAKERMEIMQSAGSDVISNLLPIIDDFDRAVENNKKVDDVDTLRDGFELIRKRLKHILEQSGVEEMDSIGDEFDTDKHEAIANIPAPSKKQKGKVIDVTEKGYYYKGKILRFAKVVVGQ